LQKGYESTTMSDVMRLLDIAKGTIYHYFRSKEEFLDAVLLYITDGEHRRIQQIFDTLQGNALERLQALIFSINHENHDTELLENLHKPANAGMHIRLHARTLLMLTPFFAELFEKGRQEGVFHLDDPLACAEFIFAATSFLTDMGFYPWTRDQLKRRIKAMPNLIERQLGAAPGSFDFLRANLQEGLQQGQDTKDSQ
jgi:AcrR family transcriptional regulator